MKYRYKLTFHMVGGEVFVSESESENKPNKDNIELAIAYTMKKDYLTEITDDLCIARGINMRNVLYVDFEYEEVL